MFGKLRQSFYQSVGRLIEHHGTTLLGQCLQAGHPSFLLWKETFKTELLIRQSGSHQCRYKSCRSRQALHFDAVTHTLSDYQKARVGYTRRTCIRNQSYSFSPLYSINNTFNRFMFIKFMVRLHRILYFEVFQQYAGGTCILSKYQIHFFQNPDSTECHIFQISYRGRHYIKFSHTYRLFS